MIWSFVEKQNLLNGYWKIWTTRSCKFTPSLIIKGNKNDMAHLGNMDKTTPTFFDIDKKEEDYSVKTTGHEKQHFTVVLAFLTDGTKLPPMIIFERKSAKGQVSARSRDSCTKKRWMDNSGCIKWIKKVLGRRPGAMLKPKSLLVWDIFISHLRYTTKKALKSTKTALGVRGDSKGLTSVLPPLDVSLNKPYTDSMRFKWNEWVASGQKNQHCGRKHACFVFVQSVSEGKALLGLFWSKDRF